MIVGAATASRRPRAVAGLVLLALAGSTSARAWAGAGAMFGEASRAAALADSVTARASELAALTSNPGALATLERGMFEATAHVGRLELGFARDGEEGQQWGRTLAGFGVGVGTRLPGPDWLHALRLGVTVHVPATHALRFVAPARADEPAFPVYGSRTERTAFGAAVAYELFSRLGIGVGCTLVPGLTLPTRVTYEAGRGATPQENVVIDLERELGLGVAPLVGVRAQVIDELALGVAVQGEIVQEAEGPNDVSAGGLTVQDQLDFYDLLSPGEFAAGVAVYPIDGWSVSVDGVLVRWSRYRTIHDEPPPRAFADVVHLRTGLEVEPVGGLQLRGGYAFEPSPLPAQDGATNLLGGDAHVAAVGAGVDFREWDLADVRIDLHLRANLLATQEEAKRREALPDADRAAPGQQVDNLGYPAFSAWGSFWQAGLSVNVFLGPREP